MHLTKLKTTQTKSAELPVKFIQSSLSEPPPSLFFLIFLSHECVDYPLDVVLRLSLLRLLSLLRVFAQ